MENKLEYEMPVSAIISLENNETICYTSPKAGSVEDVVYEYWEI